MFKRGSKRSAKRTKTTGKYRQQVIEALETRQLLTTLYGGGAGRAAQYFYTTAGAVPPAAPTAEITIYGDVTAEFIFVDGSGNVVNRPLIGNTIASDAGLDLFAVYVSHSDINSYISIEQLGSSDPLGGVTSLSIIAANPKASPTPASSGSGSLRLGALSGGATGSAVIKTNINGAAIGVRPAGLDDLPDDPGNDLSAGLVVANGCDLGKFLFDGEVFGKVHVDGSMNLFYAGWLLTGDARGASDGGDTTGLPISLADNFVTAADTALGASGHIVPRQNFYIGGDLQNLVSDGAIGWDATFGIANPDTAPYFLSGTDIYVRGRLGQIHANNGNAATVTVLNLDPATAGFVRPIEYQEELEGYNRFPGSGVVGDTSLGFPNTPASDFSGGVLYAPRTGRGVVPTTNDTFDSFQMLAPFSSSRGNDIVDLLGTIEPGTFPDQDPIDFYGVALMAGQTITIQAIDTRGSTNLHVGVYDPDGRLIASDYSNLNTPNNGQTATTFIPFQITADRPGIYRIAIAEGGDTNFVGTPTSLSWEQYELVIGGLGNVGFGGLTVSDQKTSGPLVSAGAARMLDLYEGTHAVEVTNGDFGGIYISAQYNSNGLRQYFPTVTPAPGSFNFSEVFGAIYVANGNLRVVDASQIGVGTLTSDTTNTGLDINVPNGSVGLIQTRLATGVLQLNPSVRDNFSDTLGTPAVSPSPTTPTAFTPAELSIGGSYQVINAAGRFYGAVAAKAGMGILRAGTIDGIGDQTFIYLDTDNQGFDGKSDLIDVSGSIDGPALLHGPGGNFRYMRVGGTIGVDSYFGSSDNGYIAHNYGESVQITDDSGSVINLTPVGQPVANPAFDPLDPSKGPQFLYPQLATMAYPVRTGGQILMDVQSTGSLAVNTQSGAANGTAEISRIEVHGAGAAPTRTTRLSKGTYQTSLALPFNSSVQGNSLTVTISGSAITDVAYIVGMVPEPGNSFFTDPNATEENGNLVFPFRSTATDFGNLTLVSNNTGGEILSVNAANLGTLFSSGTVGVTRTTTIAGNALNFIDSIAVGTSYGTRAADASGNAPVNPTSTAGTAVGDSYPFNHQTFGIAIGGDIVEIRANLGLGNIVATGIIGSVVANADGKNVPGVVEGINAPIYADSATAVVSPSASSGVPSGSILSVNIGEGVGSAGSGDFAYTGIFAGNSIGSIVGNNADIRGDIVFGQTLGSITLNNGSLIDANILNLFTAVIDGARESAGTNTLINVTNGGVVRSIGSINIKGNGGMLGTVIGTTRIGSINVAGFGIISSEIVTAFATTGIATMTVGGYGIRNSIISSGSINSINLTGNGKDLSTSQISAAVRQSEYIHVDSQFNFGFDPYSGRALTPMNDIHAALGTSQATPRITGVTDTGVVENSRITGQGTLGSIKAQVFRGDPSYNRLAFGNSIGTIQARGKINGLAVVTGHIKSFLPGASVGNLQMSVSGLIDKLTLKGTLDSGSTIYATGTNGRIGKLTIKGNLNGTIHADQTIDTVIIGGNLNGTLKVDALNRKGIALKKLQVGGTISNGSLDVGGDGIIANAGQIIVGKGLGASATDSVNISGSIDRLQVGGALNASVHVGNGIGTLQAGSINGPVNVDGGGGIKNLFVKGGGLNGDVTLGNGKLQNAIIAGGITGDIKANNGIGTITVSSGNIAAGTTIGSDFAGIDTIRVAKGSLFGSVASAGQIKQIVVGGNVGDGVTPLTISATRLGLLQVGGSIKNNANIHITGPLDALIVGGNIDAAAVVQASAITSQKVDGQIFGSVVIS